MKRFIKVLVLLVLVLTGLWSVRTYQQIQHVLTYRPLVKEVLAETGSPAGQDLILAMIYTETKGKSDDLIQSSESLTGLPGHITDNKESLIQGITVLSENFVVADEADVDVWTAVQAYNFGTAYIDYVADRGSVTTVDLAKTYSREVVAPSLGNTDGQTYPYYNPIALWHGGTSLYRNGGNSYYAKQVAFNLRLVKLVTLFAE